MGKLRGVPGGHQACRGNRTRWETCKSTAEKKADMVRISGPTAGGKKGERHESSRTNSKGARTRVLNVPHPPSGKGACPATVTGPSRELKKKEKGVAAWPKKVSVKGRGTGKREGDVPDPAQQNDRIKQTKKGTKATSVKPIGWATDSKEKSNQRGHEAQGAREKWGRAVKKGELFTLVIFQTKKKRKTTG